MVNATEFRARCAVLLLAAFVLTATAWLRGAEYDEQYTLFLTAGNARPDWPVTVFPASAVAAAQAGHATMGGIARDLRATDVHPPLYFWAVSIWRAVLGPTLFAARLFSVLCGVASIGLVGIIARRCAIRPALAMLVTLGCYGFVYTSAIARGFAPAEMLLLSGVALLLGRRPVLAGVCLGAACCCNYLAVFVAAAAIVASGAWLAIPATLPFLALDTWFFAAQHAARTGQFPPFEVWASVVRLGEYETAALMGGLPLYVDAGWRIAAKGAVGVATIGLTVIVWRTRPWAVGAAMRLLLLSAVAPPAGLLLLGMVFNNTPIELRYLSFGLPFIALLVAWQPRTSWTPRLLLMIQFASIVGLLLSPRTMQPARIAAGEAARLAGDAVVLVPAGNDGVGVVGAFGIEAPARLPLLVIRLNDPIAARIGPYHRVAVAGLAQDRDSTAIISNLHAALDSTSWRRVAIGSNLEVYERTARSQGQVRPAGATGGPEESYRLILPQE